MASIEVGEPGGELADGAGIPIGRRAHGRNEYEMLGLLLGIFGVLLVLAVTLGAAPLV